MTQAMLELREISTHYGAICAVNNVSLHVNQGEIVSLIGSNGAGKTTLLMTVCGNPRLAPLIITQIFEIIKTIRAEGVTVFLVEQNANKALAIADRGYVLENGRVVLEDTGTNLLTNPEVRKAYLGA